MFKVDRHFMSPNLVNKLVFMEQTRFIKGFRVQEFEDANPLLVLVNFTPPFDSALTCNRP